MAEKFYQPQWHTDTNQERQRGGFCVRPEGAKRICTQHRLEVQWSLKKIATENTVR